MDDDSNEACMAGDVESLSGLAADTESLVLPALQRCVDELAAAGGGGDGESSAVLGRLADHLCPALAVTPQPDAPDQLGPQLVCRLWNLPLREPLGQLTSRLCRRLAAELLQLLAGAAPLPLAGGTQVLLTAARQCVADGELSRALALSELALRDLLRRRAAAEGQLATFARRADTLRRLAAIEQDRFGCLMVRAETLFLREDWPAVDEAVREAGGARDASGDQLRYMQRLMFNFGLNRYRQRDWPRAARWLASSMEVGQGLARSHSPVELRARTLDLLARTHLQAGTPTDLQRATQLLQLAFSESPSLTLRLLILSCELRRRAAGDGQQAAAALQHCVQDASDWCRQSDDLLRLSDLLQQHGCHQEALTVLRRAADAGCTADVCRRSVHLLLTLDRPEEALETLSEYCSQPDQDRDGRLVAGQVAALEACFATQLEAEDCEPATQLLLRLAELPGIEAAVAARLLRNVARCQRRGGELAAAETALRRALELQPGSPAALYLLLQLLMAAGQAESALELLPAIESVPDRAAVARLWRHLCGFSLGRQMAGLFERLLEAVVRHLDRPDDSVPLLQCLVRCRIESLENDAEAGVGPLLSALETALGVLQRCQTADEAENRGAPAGWFSDVAWNVAVHGELEPADRGRLFTLSRLFLEFNLRCSQDPAGLALCRTAAVTAAAAALEAARQQTLTQRQKHAHLREALSCVEECHALTARLGGGAAGWTDHEDLLLYQLEAKAGLSAPDLDSLVSAVVCRPDTEAHTLERMAALLAGRPELTVRALRAAADRLLTAAATDWDRLSALQTRYTSLMLDHVDGPGLPADRVLAAVLAVRDSIRRADGRYPNMTTLYVMTRTWNQAVRLALQGQRQQANRWAAAARSLSALLAAQTDWYRQRMRLLPSAEGAPPPAAAVTGHS